MADALERQATSSKGFIRAYGMFWSAGEVDWTGRETNGYAELLGRVNMCGCTLKVANFWGQQGIYVLYNDHGPYYVGRTTGQTLGVRLRQHEAKGSPHRGNWTRFSWFGWRGTLKSTDERGLANLRKVPNKLLTDSQDTVADIEALLIEAMGTRWVRNARKEHFAAAANGNRCVGMSERSIWIGW